MQASPFTHNFLLIFAGPLIWAVHFIAIYGFTGILCARLSARLEWFGIGIVSWGIVVATIIAIAAIGAVYLWAAPKRAVQDNRAFIQWMSAALSLLSIIAILWETLPIFLIPACA